MSVPEDEKELSGPESEPQEVLSLEQLRSMYGGKGNRAKKYPTKSLFVCALLALFGCIALAVMTFASYAYPLTVIGNRRFAEGNLSLFGFLADRIEKLRSTVNGIADDNAEAIFGVFGIVQAAVAVAVAFGILISSVVYTILAAVRFSGRKDTVGAALIGMMRWDFTACILYPFFVNTSGGQGDAYYSIGFAPGIGMSIGMALGLGILCASAICTCLAYPKERKTYRTKWGCAAIETVVCTCGCGIFCALPLYSVVMYVFSSSLVSVFGAIASGAFSFSGFAFTLLNLLLFICAVTAYQLLSQRAEKNWKYLVCHSVFFQSLAPPAKKKRRPERAGPLLRPVILSALCIVSAAVLGGVPSVGLGWSVQLIPQFAALLAVSAAGLVAFHLWKGRCRASGYEKREAVRT